MVLVRCTLCRAVPLSRDAMPLFWRVIPKFLVRISVKGSRFFCLQWVPS